MSDLLKLDNISKRNGDIKAFPLSSNLKTGQTGRSDWGSVSIAVDNASVTGLLSERVIGILYIIGKDEWEKEEEGQSNAD